MKKNSLLTFADFVILLITGINWYRTSLIVCGKCSLLHFNTDTSLEATWQRCSSLLYIYKQYKNVDIFIMYPHRIIRTSAVFEYKHRFLLEVNVEQKPTPLLSADATLAYRTFCDMLTNLKLFHTRAGNHDNTNRKRSETSHCALHRYHMCTSCSISYSLGLACRLNLLNTTRIKRTRLLIAFP